jgi:hypothetical protein
MKRSNSLIVDGTARRAYGHGGERTRQGRRCSRRCASEHQDPKLEKLYTDGAYGGKCAHDLDQAHHIRDEVVRRPGNGTIGTLHDPKTGPEQAAVVNAGFVILRENRSSTTARYSQPAQRPLMQVGVVVSGIRSLRLRSISARSFVF